MLPETLLSLLHATLVLAQAQQKLSLNAISSFTPSNIPNPPLFTLPQSRNLFITVALCSATSPPQFFVSNSSNIDTTGSEITITDGLGKWTGPLNNGAVLSVVNAGQSSFELAASEDGAIHEILQTPPFLGDTTSNQALLFSAPFSPSVLQKPTYPNYTLPAANLSTLAPPTSPNFTLIVALSSSSLLTSLPQTACMLSAQRSRGTVRNQSLWLRDEEGWRSQWFLEGLAPATNYTAYVVQDSRKVSGPMHFLTKSASFTCPLVFGLPYCPNIAYTVPLPLPPTGAHAYDSTNLPSEVTTPFLSYLTNFTVMLTTTACGRDLYSPIVGCDDCQRAYRRWLCTITFTRCGEPSNPSRVSAIPPAPDATGLSAFRPSVKGQPPQPPFSALVPQSTNTSEARNPNLPGMGSTYTMLLPCLERCTAADRACPTFLGFKCPIVRFNAAASYGVGYVDSANNVEGKGVTGVAQDRWGNIWCNGG